MSGITAAFSTANFNKSEMLPERSQLPWTYCLFLFNGRKTSRSVRIRADKQKTQRWSSVNSQHAAKQEHLAGNAAAKSPKEHRWVWKWPTANQSFHLEQTRSFHLWLPLHTCTPQKWENLLLWTRRPQPCCWSLHPGCSPHQGRAGSHRSTSSSWLPPAVGGLCAHDRRRMENLEEKQTRNLNLADH